MVKKDKKISPGLQKQKKKYKGPRFKTVSGVHLLQILAECFTNLMSILTKQPWNIGRRQLDICDVLRDLVPSVQFKKRKKRSWRSVGFFSSMGVFHVF